jgi:phage terminase Nu1 subunit (DNA packaging protein)
MAAAKSPAKKPRGARRSRNQLLESAERAKYYKAKTEQLLAGNARELGLLVDPEIIVRVLERVVAEMVAALDALPSQIKTEIPHLRAAEVELIKRRLAKVRNGLARFSITRAIATGRDQ